MFDLVPAQGTPTDNSHHCGIHPRPGLHPAELYPITFDSSTAPQRQTAYHLRGKAGTGTTSPSWTLGYRNGAASLDIQRAGRRSGRTAKCTAILGASQRTPRTLSALQLGRWIIHSIHHSAVESWSASSGPTPCAGAVHCAWALIGFIRSTYIADRITKSSGAHQPSAGSRPALRHPRNQGILGLFVLGVGPVTRSDTGWCWPTASFRWCDQLPLPSKSGPAFRPARPAE